MGKKQMLTAEQRNKQRQRYVTHFCELLGVSPTRLDEMTDDERRAAIEAAIERARRERTDAQILAREGFDCEIGGRTYSVRVLSFREAKGFRALLDKAVQKAMRLVPRATDESEINLAEIAGPIMGWFAGPGMDELVELMIAYCPEMRERRDAILDAREDEVQAAALRFLEFQFPLLKAAATRAMALMGGAAATTSTGGAAR